MHVLILPNIENPIFMNNKMQRKFTEELLLIFRAKYDHKCDLIRLCRKQFSAF